MRDMEAYSMDLRLERQADSEGERSREPGGWLGKVALWVVRLVV